MPEFPQNFFEITRLIYEGKFIDFEQLGPEYYLQPEFYPSWFNVFPNSSYVKYNPDYWTPEGYGCYPMIKEVSVDISEANTFVVDTFFRTGYATHAYQGLIVRPMFPASALALDGSVLFDNPEDVQSLISASIVNDDNSLYQSFKNRLLFDNVGENDCMMVLKPTHGIILDKYGEQIGMTGFPGDWVRLLEVEIVLDEDIPLGDYVVGVEMDTPCFEINQEYYFSKYHEYYGSQYFPAGNINKAGTFFQVVIHVI